MHSNAERKEAIRQYKERKPARGTFAVRSAATGRVWVGASRNLPATKNGCWFSLRLGSYPCPSLQQEWTAHGEDNFAYEIPEKLGEDVPEMEVADRLKKKKRLWVERLGAQPV